MTRAKKPTAGMIDFPVAETLARLKAPPQDMGSESNPLIGNMVADTLDNVNYVLAVLQDATEVNDSSDETGMGRYLILLTCRMALAWESEHHQLRAGKPAKGGEA